MCPEADQSLAVFVRLLADEQGALSVVQQFNIFPPNSDEPERETAPAIGTTISYARCRT
jgi:hypothetical protein